MEHALSTMHLWMNQGRPILWITFGAVVAICFVVFNCVRILLYLPQLRTCLNDRQGCSSINLWTWGSWIVANTSTALYMFMFLDEPWAALLQMGNAVMCCTIVCITLVKRRRHSFRSAALGMKATA